MGFRVILLLARVAYGHAFLCLILASGFLSHGSFDCRGIGSECACFLVNTNSFRSFEKFGIKKMGQKWQIAMLSNEVTTSVSKILIIVRHY